MYLSSTPIAALMFPTLAYVPSVEGNPFHPGNVLLEWL